jgi:hypothetical protein
LSTQSKLALGISDITEVLVENRQGNRQVQVVRRPIESGNGEVSLKGARNRYIGDGNSPLELKVQSGLGFEVPRRFNIWMDVKCAIQQRVEVEIRDWHVGPADQWRWW